MGWVGACAFPDYTFQAPSPGVGVVGGTGATLDVSATGLGGITSTSTSSTDAGASDSTNSATTAVAGGSGGDGGSAGGDNLAGSAGEGVDAGAASGGTGGTAGGGGPTTSGGSGGSGGGGDTGSGGSGGGLGPCGNDEQCRSGQCDDGWCRAEHCGNAVADELETDTDCGGPECRPCGYDQHCLEPADCATLDCSAAERCEPTLVINCSCNSAGFCNQTPQSTLVDMQLHNRGSSPIALDSLRFRYFFSAEGSGSDQVLCDQLNFTGGTCSLFDGEVLATEYEDPMATDEAAFWFSGGMLPAGESTGSIRFLIQNNGPYQRANDYSFQGVPTATGAVPAPCENIVAMNVDDVPIWGILPE